MEECAQMDIQDGETNPFLYSPIPRIPSFCLGGGSIRNTGSGWLYELLEVIKQIFHVCEYSEVVPFIYVN